MSNDEAWQRVIDFLEPEPPKFCPHVPFMNQKKFLRSTVKEVLYGGRAGGGKSDALLMAALQYVHVPDYSAILFRNSYSDLSRPGALMDRAKTWLQDHDRVQYSSKENAWRFPSGARITFGYLDGPNDHLNYKGGEYQFIGYDELTEIREEHYTYMFSRIRGPSLETGHPLAKVPRRVRSASNPAPNWVRDRFIPHPDLDAAQLKQWHRDNPSKLFISSGYTDNPYIDQVDYASQLAELDPVHRAQLEHGDWWAEVPGAKFQKAWFKIVSPEELPVEAFKGAVRYWDIAATEAHEGNKDPDWTAGALVSYYDGYLILHDVVRFRKDPGDMNKAIRDVAANDGPLVKIRMEQEPGASGKLTINHFAQHVLLGYDFDGNRAIRDKESRVSTWQPHAKRGNMILIRGSWNNAFIDECISFGAVKDAHDDQLDAVSGAFETLTGIGGDGPGKRIEIIC